MLVSALQLPVTVKFSPWSGFPHTVFLRLACVTWPTKAVQVLFFLSCRRTLVPSWWLWTLTSCCLFTQRTRFDSTPTRRLVNCLHIFLPLLTTVTSTCRGTTVTSVVSSGRKKTWGHSGCLLVVEWDDLCFPSASYWFKVMYQKNYRVHGCITSYWVNTPNVPFCLVLWWQWWIWSRQDWEHQTDPAVPGSHQWSTLVDWTAGPGGQPNTRR